MVHLSMVSLRQELREGFKQISYGVSRSERLALTLTIMLAEAQRMALGLEAGFTAPLDVGWMSAPCLDLMVAA